MPQSRLPLTLVWLSGGMQLLLSVATAFHASITSHHLLQASSRVLQHLIHRKRSRRAQTHPSPYRQRGPSSLCSQASSHLLPFKHFKHHDVPECNICRSIESQNRAPCGRCDCGCFPAPPEHRTACFDIDDGNTRSSLAQPHEVRYGGKSCGKWWKHKLTYQNQSLLQKQQRNLYKHRSILVQKYIQLSRQPILAVLIHIQVCTVVNPKRCLLRKRGQAQQRPTRSLRCLTQAHIQEVFADWN
jgi:hypothetical protein